MSELAEEKPPISEKLNVIQSITLYKTDKWWSAVALLESFGRNQIAVYLWNKKGDAWKRKQKFVIHNRAEWGADKGCYRPIALSTAINRNVKLSKEFVLCSGCPTSSIDGARILIASHFPLRIEFYKKLRISRKLGV